MLNLLRAFLRLGAEAEGEGGEQTEGGNAAVAEGDELDDLLEQVEPTTSQEEPEALVLERRKREQAEAALETERQARFRAEQAAQTQTRTQPSSEYQREEQELSDARAKLAAGQVTPEAVSWLEWRIKNDRATRSSLEASQRAESRANDAADKADFDRLELTKPKTYKKYAPRIEQAIADARSKGQPSIPRMALLRYFIGDDMMNDKLQAKPKATATAAVGRVERGKMPAARSDVNVKDRSGMTEHQKRIERMKAAHARGEFL